MVNGPRLRICVSLPPDPLLSETRTTKTHDWVPTFRCEVSLTTMLLVLLSSFQNGQRQRENLHFRPLTSPSLYSPFCMDAARGPTARSASSSPGAATSARPEVRPFLARGVDAAGIGA